MFKSKKRYITKGINSEVDVRLQILMWGKIDNLKNNPKVAEVDYLQVFEIEKKGDLVIIEHRQEVPEYKEKYAIAMPDIDIKDKIKVFVIDDGDYSTMLLAEEY